MREILFRGKGKESGEWIKGDLSQHKTGKKFIKNGNAISSFEVVPNTVGEYTGLTDKNGIKIFEGDILEFDGDHKRDTVIWGDGEYNGVSGFRLKRHPLFSVTASNHDLFEIIGNIHDNPDLLKL